ncbi:unnamed protein product, partial [Sphacelaria rigidula]
QDPKRIEENTYIYHVGRESVGVVEVIVTLPPGSKPGVSDEDNVQRVRLAPGHRCMVKRNNVYRLKNPSLKHTAVVYWATPRLRRAN